MSFENSLNCLLTTVFSCVIMCLTQRITKEEVTVLVTATTSDGVTAPKARQNHQSPNPIQGRLVVSRNGCENRNSHQQQT
jgi:hypothetical protein